MAHETTPLYRVTKLSESRGNAMNVDAPKVRNEMSATLPSEGNAMAQGREPAQNAMQVLRTTHPSA